MPPDINESLGRSDSQAQALEDAIVATLAGGRSLIRRVIGTHSQALALEAVVEAFDGGSPIAGEVRRVLGRSDSFIAALEAAIAAEGGGAFAPAVIAGSGQAQARGSRLDGIPTYGLYSHHSARDPLAYPDRVFPTDAAAVNFLRARSGLLSHMLPRADRNNPTFAANADGAGRAGLRFTAASTQAMEWPGVAPLQSADAEWTLWAVFRTAATPGGRQTLMHVNRDAAANAFRECVRLDVTATQFIVISGTNGSATDDTNSAIVAQVPAAGETYIMVGRHGTSGAGTHQNKIDLRKGGATTTVTSANNLTLNYASTAALQQGIVGGYRRGGWSQHFDGWLLDWGWYPFRLSDTDTALLIDFHRIECGVS